MTEGMIQKLLFNEYNKDVILPNVYWNNCRYEMDLVRITAADRVYEYEVKTSLADFKNEFRKKKKRKHTMYLADTKYTPHYFTLVTDCAQITAEMVSDLGSKYGLMYVVEDRRCRSGYRLKSVIRPTLLHFKPNEYAINYKKLTRKMGFKLFNNVPRFNYEG